MTALQGLLAIIKALPQLIKLFEMIGEAVSKGLDKLEVTIALNKLDDAIDTAKKTHDTSKIEDIFNPKPKS